ncbi:hypothetical protein POSPLADRAFT_1057679 [Postia placenta MAD-698-R-SB12]|uniref:Uncharacterized protein n=1 Tax=Postia placenta MAD-698-R-SB12 TaxID=670580 RepID=A0A1X6N0D3_9APHY|nr:hypothetical protein POSPLADRAFT_1057679 [Postia placenta MAD-698-R-SB12]OSX61903.1 hypothetical protein POSPLADRAFT_1057679 [Postia placenta MAD-698-R-SB12]
MTIPECQPELSKSRKWWFGQHIFYCRAHVFVDVVPWIEVGPDKDCYLSHRRGGDFPQYLRNVIDLIASKIVDFEGEFLEMVTMRIVEPYQMGYNSALFRALLSEQLESSVMRGIPVNVECLNVFASRCRNDEVDNTFGATFQFNAGKPQASHLRREAAVIKPILLDPDIPAIKNAESGDSKEEPSKVIYRGKGYIVNRETG